MRLLLQLVFLVVLSVSGRAAPDGKRVALVIGNSEYQNTTHLPNPHNDAQDVSAALSRLGFEVIEGRDLNLRSMQASLEVFARAARESEAALIFFAGHGLQHRGENFLVPIDAKLHDDISVDYQTIHIDEVLKSLDRAPGVRILILDACRNLPIPKGRPGAAPSFKAGFAKFDARRNMVLAYATGANDVAYDGAGRNSSFTTSLLKFLEKPALEIGELFRGVAAEVSSRTAGRQVPEVSRSLPGEFYFNKGESDAQAWARVRNSTDPVDFRTFVERYPDSFLVEDAKFRIAGLEREKEAKQFSRMEDSQGRESPRGREPELRLSGVDRSTPGRAGMAAARPAVPPPADETEGKFRRDPPQRVRRQSEEVQGEGGPTGVKQAGAPLRPSADQAKLTGDQLARQQIEEDERRLRQEFAAIERQQPASGPGETSEAAMIVEEERRLRAEFNKPTRAGADDAKRDDAPAGEPDSPLDRLSRSVPRTKRTKALPANVTALIRTAQEELSRIGCYTGPVSGVLDGHTQAAIKLWNPALVRDHLSNGITEELVRRLMEADDGTCAKATP
jgi:hypothetical protein